MFVLHPYPENSDTFAFNPLGVARPSLILFFKGDTGPLNEIVLVRSMEELISVYGEPSAYGTQVAMKILRETFDPFYIMRFDNTFLAAVEHVLESKYPYVDLLRDSMEYVKDILSTLGKEEPHAA